MKKDWEQQCGKKKRDRECRCKIRYAPPDIMAKCPPIVTGWGANMHDCQNDAKFGAPQECRRYYGHCEFVPSANN